jgi:sugar phosphate isomerase/epimerase
MRLGNAAWGYRETPLEEQLRITSAMGLDLLELSIAGHPNDFLQLDATPEQIAKVKELFAQYNIELSCTSTGSDFTQANKEDNIASMQNVFKVIDICAGLNATWLRIFAGFSPVAEITGERWETMIDCLKKVGDYAAAANIVPVIETHGGVNGYDDGVEHFYSTSSEPSVLQKMLNELPDTLKINFDPANLYAVGIEHPGDVYKQIRDRVAYVHLKDFVRLPSGHFLPAACGESDMDWDGLMAAMADYTGPALIEYENVEDVEDGCRRSVDFLRKYINK